MSPLLVPLALDKNGVKITPTCEKEHGPFKCIQCSQELTLKQGKIKRWHFSHKNNVSTCNGGGESAIHLAAKMFLEKFITKIRFSESCVSGNHYRTIKYHGVNAKQEYRFDNCIADVAVFNEKGLMVAILEVKNTHSTTEEGLESRYKKVGRNNVWEIDAFDVIDSQNNVYLQKDIELQSSLIYNTPECNKECVFITKRCLTKKPCEECKTWGSNYIEIASPRRLIKSKNFNGYVSKSHVCIKCHGTCICGEPCNKKYIRCWDCNKEWFDWKDIFDYYIESGDKERAIKMISQIPDWKEYKSEFYTKIANNIYMNCESSHSFNLGSIRKHKLTW